MYQLRLFAVDVLNMGLVDPARTGNHLGGNQACQGIAKALSPPHWCMLACKHTYKELKGIFADSLSLNASASRATRIAPGKSIHTIFHMHAPRRQMLLNRQARMQLSEQIGL
eukprot:6192708-Pleurochrysis_carterae.AAC.2